MAKSTAQSSDKIVSPYSSSKAEQETSANGSDAPLRTEQEVQVAELKAKKMASLQSQIDCLKTQIEETRAKKDEVASQLESLPTTTTNAPQTIISQHIHLLHSYNTIRDIGMSLLGLVAENRGVRVRDLYDTASGSEGEFGVKEGD
ncbi:hypothetical protein MMC24_004467 [Lignoscripta atroalba]|nr:hypothetical protein [Lignoscripta atroalba]